MDVLAKRLDGLAVTLVGPGRVGSSLATWLHVAGASVRRVVGRDEQQVEELASRLGAAPVSLKNLVPLDGDLLVLAVADSAIAAVATQLVRHNDCDVGVHLSGRLGPSVLAPLRPRSAVGCWHPLRAFPGVERDPARVTGTVLGVDGDPVALELGARIAAALDLELVRVPEPLRDHYHLAATVAAGGVASCLAGAIALAGRLGLDPAVARGYCELARSAVAAVERAGSGELAGAVTGPAARRESSLPERLERLVQCEPELGAIATFAALAALRLRRAEGLGDEALDDFEAAVSRAFGQSELP